MLAIPLYLCSGPKCHITIMQRGILNEPAEDTTHIKIHCPFLCYLEKCVTLIVDVSHYNPQSPFVSSVPLLMRQSSCLLKFTTCQAEIRGLSNSDFHCSSHHDHRYFNRQHKPELMQLHGCKVTQLRHATEMVLLVKHYLSPRLYIWEV